MDSLAIDRRALPADARLSRWQAPDGWSYRRIDWSLPDAARGSLLFAGGRGDFIEKYVEPLGHWRAQGWRVTSFDWRSQGGSRGDIAGGHLDSLDVLVDDLAALIEDWRREAPGPHVVIAHSMGGHVLARVLAERRPALDAAVLVAPMLMVNSAPFPAWAAAWIAAGMTAIGFGKVPLLRGVSPLPPTGSPRQAILTGCPERYSDELYWWQKEPGYNLGGPSWGWVRAAFRSSAALTRDRLAGIEVAVLLVATARDRLVSPTAIRKAAATIPGAELLMFPDAGHEILREADPVRLEALAAIDDFLARKAGA
ncbi:alpha/beta hydrolase [Sphingomonas parva]|uniref:Alpha/beta hydrolase n=1 Tax=Sphingomonas parva TaxID=2555898 RepID=A0A4Y8ZQX8_9SPHN|nr:alpha/beta hydrolase [Sphingomonas parva]TFI57867.1 alpha/beta hydrolase [Sphingomonas parva]